MSDNFIFYDTETSGRDPFFDQIFQFAAVLTDAELNPIDEVEYRARRMAHIVPSAGALLVNGLNPFNLSQAQFSAYEFAQEIKSKILQWSPAVVSGYNIFSFDNPACSAIWSKVAPENPCFENTSSAASRIIILFFL